MTISTTPTEKAAQKAREQHDKLMRSGRAATALLKGRDDDVSTSGELRIQEWSKGARILRSLKFFGACLGLSIASVLVPILHFILVPGFLLAAPIVAIVVFTKRSVILGGEGICPFCNKTMKIGRHALRFPFFDTCDHCLNNVKIEIVRS